MIETQPREIARGKTKIITLADDNDDEVDVGNGNVVTALDGKRKSWFERKGEYSTQTNHYAMKLLESAGIPVAYIRRTGPDTFRARRCEMLPYEVVAVRQVDGESSFLKRNPDVSAGHVFEELQVSFFLKTSELQFKGITFDQKDDPLIASISAEGVLTCRPDKPVGPENATRLIPADLLYGTREVHPFEEMDELMRKVFVVLERGWRRDGCRLLDLKIEFGITRGGHLFVADVIDADSWRLLSRFGAHLDKQPFRNESVSIEVLAERYREVAERIVRFKELDGRALLAA